jgi:hypothetical protein
MNDKLKQCVMEMLRMGEDPEDIQLCLEHVHTSLNGIKEYIPNHDMADFYRAYKDADFRP